MCNARQKLQAMAAEEGKLEELPGIGDRMAEHIQEILKTGDYSLRKKLLKKYPATLLEVLTLQGLGPKKVAFLWSNFKAGTVADVEKLALEEKLRDVPGFGEKTEQNILKAVATHKRSTGRFLIDQAESAAAGSPRRTPAAAVSQTLEDRTHVGVAGKLPSPGSAL